MICILFLDSNFQLYNLSLTFKKLCILLNMFMDGFFFSLVKEPAASNDIYSLINDNSFLFFLKYFNGYFKNTLIPFHFFHLYIFDEKKKKKNVNIIIYHIYLFKYVPQLASFLIFKWKITLQSKNSKISSLNLWHLISCRKLLYAIRT